MSLTVFVILALSSSSRSLSRFVVYVVQDIAPSSKTQPDNPSLGSNVSEKVRGEVPFTHKAHSTDAKYSVDGKTIVSCAERHHTDQPPGAKCGASAKGFKYSTFERKVCLTAAELTTPDTPPVKSCNSCHFSPGDTPKDAKLPVGGPKNIELNSGEAYHLNCVECHKQARAAREDATNAPVYNQCSGCHK